MSNNGTGFWLTLALIAVLGIAMIVEATLRLVLPAPAGKTDAAPERSAGPFVATARPCRSAGFARG